MRSRGEGCRQGEREWDCGKTWDFLVDNMDLTNEKTGYWWGMSEKRQDVNHDWNPAPSLVIRDTLSLQLCDLTKKI